MPKKKKKKKKKGKRRKSKRRLLKGVKEKTTELPQLHGTVTNIDSEHEEIEIDLEGDSQQYTYSDMEKDSISEESDTNQEKYNLEPSNPETGGTGGTSDEIEFPVVSEGDALEEEAISETSQFL